MIKSFGFNSYKNLSSVSLSVNFFSTLSCYSLHSLVSPVVHPAHKLFFMPSLFLNFPVIKIEREEKEASFPYHLLCWEYCLHLLTDTTSYPHYIGQSHACKAWIWGCLWFPSLLLSAWNVDWCSVAGKRTACREERCNGTC